MPNRHGVNHEFSSSLAPACEFTWCHFNADKRTAQLEPTLVWDASSTGVSWLIWWEISSFWLNGLQHQTLAWSGFIFLSLSPWLLGLWSYPFSTLLLTFWWLANWLTLLSSVQLPLHSVFSNLSSQIREKEGHRSGLLSQDEGWLSIFPQPEVPPFSSPHSLPHQHTGRIRQWEHLHWSWFQPVGQGLRPGQTWRGNCRDLVPKKTFELGKDTGVCNLKLRGPAAIATMNQRWDKLQTFLLKSLGQNLSPHLRPWAREKDTYTSERWTLRSKPERQVWLR